MPRRLFDDDEPPPGQERLLLPDTPSLVAEQGRCALGVCLAAALRLVGHEVTYERLLGLLGAAFTLRVEAGFGAELTVVDRWRSAVPVLRALGFAAELHCGPEPEETLALAQAELQAGRPLLAMGWGAYPLDWTLLVGRQGHQLLGRWPGSGTAPRAAPWITGLLVVLGGTTAPADERRMVHAALEQAQTHLQASSEHYERWEAILVREAPYGTPLQRRDQMAGEQWLVQCLVEARAAGAEFLRSSGALFAEEAEELLTEAGDGLEVVADELEALLTTPDTPGHPQLADDEEWLEARRDALRRAARREAEVAVGLAQALRVADAEV